MCTDKEFLRKYRGLDREQRRCIRRLREINKKIAQGDIQFDRAALHVTRDAES